jgi:hypothetical protein
MGGIFIADGLSIGRAIVVVGPEGAREEEGGHDVEWGSYCLQFLGHICIGTVR